MMLAALCLHWAVHHEPSYEKAVAYINGLATPIERTLAKIEPDPSYISGDANPVPVRYCDKFDSPDICETKPLV